MENHTATIWKKATTNQQFFDGDTILVCVETNSGPEYAVVHMRIDDEENNPHFTMLVEGEPWCAWEWESVDRWCYLTDIK